MARTKPPKAASASSSTSAEMKVPPYIRLLSEHVGKPISAFTKDDWRSVAFIAGRLIDRLEGRSLAAKRPGRPPKVAIRNVLHPDYRPPKESKPRGRPKQNYYGVSAELIAKILDSLEKVSAQALQRWPDAPKTNRDRLRVLLKILQEKPGGGGYHDLQSIERAVRRSRADKNRTKIET